MPNKKTKKQLEKEGKTQKEIDLYFGINEKTGRPIKWTEQKAMELANELIEWMKSSEKNMFFEPFLTENKKIPVDQISKLSKKYKSFFQAIKRAKKIQEYRIVEMGLRPKDSSVASLTQNLNKKSVTEKESSTVAIFLLKSNHGYMEEHQKLKAEQDKLKAKQDELMSQHRIEQDELMNQHKIEMDKKNHEIKIQELELKKQIAEITKKQHEDDLIHTITFDDSNPIINP